MPNQKGEPTTTINIKVSTREKLKQLGRKGDSYDDIILDLIEKARRVK